MIKELWDVYDANGNLTDKTTVRGKCFLSNGEYHLVVHIWIISSEGKLLIQKRSENKKLMPGEWAATGGAAISGEDSFTAASRELFEELGIKSDAQTLKKAVRLKRRNSFVDVWLINSDIPAEDLTLQESEVACAKWVDRQTLINMVKNGEYHDYGKDYFKTVFEKIDDFTGVRI